MLDRLAQNLDLIRQPHIEREQDVPRHTGRLRVSGDQFGEHTKPRRGGSILVEHRGI